VVRRPNDIAGDRGAQIAKSVCLPDNASAVILFAPHPRFGGITHLVDTRPGALPVTTSQTEYRRSSRIPEPASGDPIHDRVILA
jgi:hypothetical protein